MSYWKEIYTYEELHNLIQDGVIKESFWVNSTTVNKLEGVREIRTEGTGTVHFQNLIEIGELEYIDCGFSFWGNLQSFNNLKYVGGELRFGAPLKSLGALKEIKGDLRPTTNDLEDLGCLSKVGGTVDLRGMINIIDLSSLKEIGGNLNLVKSLKDQYDLSTVKVKGRTIYWNKKPTFYKSEYHQNKTKIPPVWENRGPYEFENYLVIPNTEQFDFYKYFKKSFLKGEYIDVGGMRNYIRYFIYELLSEYKINHDFESLVKKYVILREHYPNLSHDCNNIEVKIGRNLKIKKYLEIVLPHEVGVIWEQFIQKTVKQNPQKILTKNDNSTDNDLTTILGIGFKSSNLTTFGKENEEVILKTTIELIRKLEKRENNPFSRSFFDKNKFYKAKSTKGVFDPFFYKNFFNSIEEFEFFMEEHNQRMQGVPKENVLYPKYVPPIVEFAIRKRINELMREAENCLREDKGLPMIGEGWINETDLFYKVKNAFPEHVVIHHGKAKWLGLQHFDIYFPKIKIAIEYQGAQHFQQVEIFGEKEGLIRAKKNDQIKTEKCLNNDCILIEVLPGYEFNSVKENINNAIRIKTAAKT
ncbi:hypothetical protein KA005_01305 [bacterium]|nr:hypothetical protein [bacterium]